MNRRYWIVPAVVVSVSAGALANDQPEAAEPVILVNATLSDVGWLIGDWEGRDNVGDRVIERWLPPIDGVMVGTFVQTRRKTATTASIDWSEISHLKEEDGSLILYTASMQAGFELEEISTFRRLALSVEPCKLQFKDLIMECSDPKDPGSGLSVTYGEDFMNDGTGVYTVTYKKAGDD